MHRKSEAELLPLDTKIKRTLKNLRKATSTEERSMANQSETTPIEANNFELKPALITMVQQH